MLERLQSLLDAILQQQVVGRIEQFVGIELRFIRQQLEEPRVILLQLLGIDDLPAVPQSMPFTGVDQEAACTPGAGTGCRATGSTTKSGVRIGLAAGGHDAVGVQQIFSRAGPGSL